MFLGLALKYVQYQYVWLTFETTCCRLCLSALYVQVLIVSVTMFTFDLV